MITVNPAPPPHPDDGLGTDTWFPGSGLLKTAVEGTEGVPTEGPSAPMTHAWEGQTPQD